MVDTEFKAFLPGSWFITQFGSGFTIHGLPVGISKPAVGNSTVEAVAGGLLLNYDIASLSLSSLSYR